MDDKTTFAYIDETGNSDLETGKQGVSKFFIVSAILVSPADREKLICDVGILRKRYFQSGEIKSSGVGNNKIRRAKILNALNELDFKFYALSVNKERIYKDSGLQHKKSFFKYINGKLYSLLFTSFLDVHVISDEYGSDEFKKSFSEYIKTNHKPDMFYRSKFDLVNSKDEILVQLSDFVAGTLGKIYEDNSSSELNEAYIDFISSKALSIDEWPTRYQAYFNKDTTTEGYDHIIYSYSLSQAEVFIEKNENSFNEDTRLQVAVLRHITFNSRLVDKNKYVTTTQILSYLESAGYGLISSYTLRSKIIAPLRDSDVVIVSSNRGYKIPCNFSDVEAFVERVDSIVKPLISRLGRARKNLNIASKGEIEILKGPNYPHLVDFMETLEKYRSA